MTNILSAKFEIIQSVDKKELDDGYYLVRHLVTYKNGIEIFKDFAIMHESVDLIGLKPFEELPQDILKDCGYDAPLYAFRMSVLPAVKENLFFDEIIGRKLPHKVSLEELWEEGWDCSKFVLLRVNLACHRITGVCGVSLSRWVKYDKMNLYAITEHSYHIDELHEYLKSRPGVRIEQEKRPAYELRSGLPTIPYYNWSGDGDSPRYFNFWVYLDGETVDKLDKREIQGIPKEILDISGFKIVGVQNDI